MEDYVIGVDFGSDSVRAVVLDVSDGHIVGTGVSEYSRWMKGLYCNPSIGAYRQHPLDYIESLDKCVNESLDMAGKVIRKYIRGIGIDTTGSTPCPVDKNGTPLALLDEFKDNPNAMFFLWKDHTSIKEAQEFNRVIRDFGKEDYTRFQGTYSSEWYWAKMLHASRVDEKVKEKSYSWVEHCDWIPAILTGNVKPEEMYRCCCAAGHKALWHSDFNGLPSFNCLVSVDPYLAEMASHYGQGPKPSTECVGTLCKEWADRLGLSTEVKVGGSSLDAHAGAVGAGIKPHTLVKVIGTSTVDMLVSKREELRCKDLKDCCGQAENSIIPGYIGIEAGQAAFGDIYSWYRKVLMWPINKLVDKMNFNSAQEKEKYINMAHLTMINDLCAEAFETIDDENLIAVDWFNGRRYPFINESVKGGIYGLTLDTDAITLFKAIVLSTVFGSRRIFDSLVTRGLKIDEVITIGGIVKKSPLVIQMMADVLKLPIKIAKTDQACAQGAAMYAATAAGYYKDLLEAQKHMLEGYEKIYYPNENNIEKYDIMYKKHLTLGRHFEEIQKGQV